VRANTSNLHKIDVKRREAGLDRLSKRLHLFAKDKERDLAGKACDRKALKERL
jgi:hypothetical protein